MAEYLVGKDFRPFGPDVDKLTDDGRASIDACLRFFAANADRMKHFTQRVRELGRSGADTVITLIDVDDPTGHGKILADMLVPDENWQQYRDRGEVPVARGLAASESFPEILEELGYSVAAHELARSDDLQVVVLHAGTVQVMQVQFS
jgi:hypothetical protein